MRRKQHRSTDKMRPFTDFIPDPLPWVPLERWPRGAHQTDEQYAAEWEMNKRTHRRWVVMLATFQALATAYGYHKTCHNPVCRRKFRCTGIRLPGSKDTYPIPLFPLCGTIDMAERVRAGIREMGGIRDTKHEVLVAPDGSLHPGEEVLEDET